MPTYVYECVDCNHDIERNVPIAERDDQDCPDCISPMKRKIAFKGLTWAPTAGGMR